MHQAHRAQKRISVLGKLRHRQQCPSMSRDKRHKAHKRGSNGCQRSAKRHSLRSLPSCIYRILSSSGRYHKKGKWRSSFSLLLAIGYQNSIATPTTTALTTQTHSPMPGMPSVRVCRQCTPARAATVSIAVDIALIVLVRPQDFQNHLGREHTAEIQPPPRRRVYYHHFRQTQSLVVHP